MRDQLEGKNLSFKKVVNSAQVSGAFSVGYTPCNLDSNFNRA